MKAKDLAKKLGVSPATISLVLNNKPGISDSLRQSLLEKIRALDCESMMCEACREGEAPRSSSSESCCKSIAYLSYLDCEEDSHPFGFFPGVLEGAEMEARDNDLSLTVFHMKCQAQTPCAETLPDLFRRSGNIVGAVVQAARITPEILQEIKSVNVPAVFLNVYDPVLEVNCVRVDNRQSMAAIVNYLKSRGHTEIGYVESGREGDWQKERHQCFCRAMEELELQTLPEFFFSAGAEGDLYDCRQLMEQFSKAERLPTALVCENDRQGMRAVNALTQLGYRVPEDVSVIGFDNDPLCKMVSPRLTTAGHSGQLMGRACIMLLQNLQKLKKAGFPSALLKYELPAELVVRDSVKDRSASAE